MVAFETLLLGVMFGRAPIGLMVAPPVARVELRLDGELLGNLYGPPWSCEHDFGGWPVPHELTALAFDASERQVGRATQWVNFGRQRAAVTVLLEREPASGRPLVADVAWSALEQAPPEAVTATLDGVPLPVPDPRRIPLPQITLDEPHLLSVEVTFREDLRERADLAFGGDVIDTAETELTAIAIQIPPKEKSFTVRDARGVFLMNEKRVEPLAVETSRADVALVIDQGTWPFLRGRNCIAGPRVRPTRLREDRDRFFPVHTVPRYVQGSATVTRLFPMMRPWALSWLDEYCTLQAASYPTELPESQKTAEAVGVAAAEVAKYNHRRAVVLLLGDKRTPGDGDDLRRYDGSTLGVAPAKAYLSALTVPLFVWSLAGAESGPLTAAWGPAEDVSTPRKLRAAFRKLKASLDAQRIVWFSGRHLPQRIKVDESATELRMAR